jgi:hypothetical protein
MEPDVDGVENGGAVVDAIFLQGVKERKRVKGNS